VNAAIAQRLVALNRQFYQSLAAPFSATRARLQPGVLRVLEPVPASADVLDLGCGNGGVAAELLRRGHQGRYVGLDLSEELLQFARARVADPHYRFVKVDLTGDFTLQPALNDERFDFVFAFAVLHHIPSRDLRLHFLRQVADLLAPGDLFVHSNWQFLNSPRLRTRVQPWNAIDLSYTDVDDGDYLLDWRSGGTGLRYVHHFTEEEMAELGQTAGFVQADSFLSDGKAGNLALYQAWKPQV
jgi:tRNA (uracil-5-)-methyltransferase TRM9